MIIALMVGVGCKSEPSMGQYDVVVSLDQSLIRADKTFPTMEVDLVGVNADAGGDRLSHYSMSDYFTPGDTMRAGASRMTMVFRSNEKATTQTLKHDDKIWKTWKDSGVMQLYVLAFLPGVHKDADGSDDARRLIIPLDKRRWDISKLQLNIKASGVRLLQSPKPAP